MIFLRLIQGEEICASLKTHINDVMLRSNSTAKSAASVSTNGDISDKFRPSNGEAYEKCIEDLSRALEESKRAANQVSNLAFENLAYCFYLLYK